MENLAFPPSACPDRSSPRPRKILTKKKDNAFNLIYFLLFRRVKKIGSSSDLWPLPPPQHIWVGNCPALSIEARARRNPHSHPDVDRTFTHTCFGGEGKWIKNRWWKYIHPLRWRRKKPKFPHDAVGWIWGERKIDGLGNEKVRSNFGVIWIRVLHFLRFGTVVDVSGLKDVWQGKCFKGLLD